jgi:hypothetical protein
MSQLLLSGISYVPTLNVHSDVWDRVESCMIRMTPCTQTKNLLSNRILSSYFPFWYNYNILFYLLYQKSLLLRAELAHLFLFDCAVSLAWGQKAYFTIVQSR